MEVSLYIYYYCQLSWNMIMTYNVSMSNEYFSPAIIFSKTTYHACLIMPMHFLFLSRAVGGSEYNYYTIIIAKSISLDIYINQCMCC